VKCAATGPARSPDQMKSCPNTKPATNEEMVHGRKRSFGPTCKQGEHQARPGKADGWQEGSAEKDLLAQRRCHCQHHHLGVEATARAWRACHDEAHAPIRTCEPQAAKRTRSRARSDSGDRPEQGLAVFAPRHTPRTGRHHARSTMPRQQRPVQDRASAPGLRGTNFWPPLP
jgi:hypothetical protein